MGNYNPLYTQYLMDNYGVAWFKFDETITTSVIDSKGSSNSGVVTGTSVISGVVGNARSFNGTSDYIRYEGNYLIPTGKKSIRFKFRAPFVTTSINRYLFSNFDSSSTQQGIGILVTPSGSLSIVGAAATSSSYRYSLTTPQSVCDDQWHDVLFTWDGTTSVNSVKLYIDDMKQPVAQTTSLSIEPAAYYTGGSSIGRLGGNANGQYLRCDIDEFEIYRIVIDPLANKILLSSGSKNYSLEEPVKETAVPVMTSASNANVEITASAYNASDFPWYAFDGNADAPRPFWYASSTPPAGGHWLQVKFVKPKVVTGISLASFVASGSAYSIKEFELYGSNDGIVYEKLYINTQPNEGTRIYYDFENSKSYSYYRLNILNSYLSASNIGVNEMEIFEEKSTILHVLDSGSDEVSFIKYGMNGDISINEMVGQVKDVIKTNLTLGSGKIFEHTVDMSKRRVDKITLG